MRRNDFYRGQIFAGKGDGDRAYETPVSEDAVKRDKAVSPANVIKSTRWPKFFILEYSSIF